VNRSTGKIPFQIVYGSSPKGVVYFVYLLNLVDKMSVDASDFVDIMHKLHEQVEQKLQESNNKYKQRTNL
jgi:hypothetical protein